MFPSIASSHSSSGVFGQETRKGDAFSSSAVCSGTVFASSSGMSNYGGTSSSMSTSPLSSTTFGAPSSTFMNDSHSTSGLSGMTNYGGTSTSAFSNTSPISSTASGAPFYSGFGSFSSTLLNGSPATKLAFNDNQSHLGSQLRGSRITVYNKTPAVSSNADKVVSISAMSAYNDKNHEELRWEDYNITGKGWFNSSSSTLPSTKYYTASQPITSSSFTPMKQTPLFPPSNPFDKTSTWNSLGRTSTSQPFKFSPSANAYSTTITSNSLNPFDKTFPSAATKTTNWNFPGPTSTSQPFQFSPSANACSTTVTSNSFNPFIPKTNHTTTVSTAPFNSFFPGKNLTSTATAPSVSVAPLNQNLFINPFTSLATRTSSLNPYTLFTGPPPSRFSTPIVEPFKSTATAAVNSNLFSPVTTSDQNCNGSTTGIIGQSSVSQLPLSQITNTGKPSSVASPFGILPPNPRICFDGSQSIQYGISSIPIKDKPAPVKHSLLTARHLTGRIKLPVRKYDPKLIAPKKPFFCDTDEIRVPEYIPRENPRAFVVCPEKWSPRTVTDIVHDEKLSDNTSEDERDDTILDVPLKLKQRDYYTQPQISELEAKERYDRGYCTRVKDFAIGRYGYGSIKFLGETDVRNIDIETHVRFNNREVIVYMDDSKKPPVGEGLNKPAEITLLNVKCIDKKTGMQYTNGSKINKYTEMLKKKAEAQGAEFVSYDPVEGEWKFRVQHF